MTTRPNTILQGYCQCGCGRKTRIATSNSFTEGYIKGKPFRYIQGHHQSRITPRVPTETKLVDGKLIAAIDILHGQFAVVDASDLPVANLYPYWTSHKTRSGTIYVRTSIFTDGKKKEIQLGRLLLGLKSGDIRQADHKNGNGLDNRRSNLRIATNQQNCCNKTYGGFGISRLKGVTWHAPTRQWRARIGVGMKRLHLGLFPTKEAAFKAYRAAQKQYHGEFARQS